MSPDTVRDRISFSSDLGRLKVPAFLVIDALQHSPKDVQLEALALTLTVSCRTLNIDPHELISRAKRQLSDADTVRSPHIEAIAEYASGELK